jgi:hypothetical protein
MTIEEIIAKIDAADAEVTILRFKEPFIEKWHVKLVWRRDKEIKLEIETKGDDFAEALTKAWEKLEHVANKGLPMARLPAVKEWAPTVIEPDGSISTDDDTPF